MGLIIRDGVIYSGGGNSNADVDPGITLTQAEYDALSDEEKVNGLYYITDGYSGGHASNIEFNNTNSGMVATSVQGAIDELSDKVDHAGASINDNAVNTEETWSSSKIQKTIENITVSGEGSGSAITTAYDNSTSGLSAGSVQGAIDEIAGEYLPLSGGTLNGDLTLKKHDNGKSVIEKGHTTSADYGTQIYDFDKDENYVALMLRANYDLAAKAMLTDGTSYYRLYGEHNKPTANDVGALPLTGGTLSGNEVFLTNGYGRVQSSSDAATMNTFDTPKDMNNRRSFAVNNHNYKSNIIDALQLTDILNGTVKEYRLYGEHNKPSGSYTGNGSATERRINIGGIGRTLYIYASNGYSCNVDNNGAISHADTNTQIVSLLRNELRFVEGELIIATTNDRCNENGRIYYYEVK